MSSGEGPATATPRAGVGWDSFVPARRYQSLWVGLGVLSGLPGLAATALRLTGPTDDIPAMVASFASYGVLAYLVALPCFTIALVRARRRTVLAVISTLCAGLLACHLAWLAPFFVSDDRPATTPSFTLLSLNTLHGTANQDDLLREAREADVVVLLEATPPLVDGLRSRGWNARFPYSVGALGTELGDTLLYSRFPLSDQALLPTSEFQQWVASVDVPRVGAVRIIAAHPCNPFCPRHEFRTEHEQLQTATVANLGHPLVVVGDLNAVDDHAPMRALRRVGLESVTDILGAGWLPTYPANRAVPPLLPIDHILVDRFLTATSVRRVHVRDTDHLGLVAQLAGTR